jgi:ATP-binding cassette subfamily B protein
LTRPRRYRQPLLYIAREWRWLAAIGGLTTMFSWIAALQPWPMKILVDHALGGAPAPAALAAAARFLGMSPSGASLVAMAAAASLLLFAVNSMLNLALTWAWAVAGQHMVYNLSTDLFHRLQRLSLRYHSSNGVGDSLSRLSGDTWCVYTLTGHLFTPLEQTMTIATMGALAWRLNPRLTLLAFATAPLIAALSFYFGKKLKTRALRGREAGTRLVSFVQQTLAAMPVVQAFGAERRNSETFRRLSDEAIETAQQGTVLGAAYGLATGLVSTAGTALVLFYGSRQVLAGSLSVGSLIVFLSYMRSIQNATEALLKLYSSIKPVEASVDRVLEVLGVADDEIRDKRGARPAAMAPAGQRGSVTFENVTFGYDRDRPVLKNVTLDVRAGETVALVGATGAGKSTLVSLIPRFVDPDEGRVRFDGVDVRDLQVASLREQVAIVLQEPFLFPLTVAENIAYGRLEATRQEIVDAAVAANADDFIRRLPDGYDTVLGERGATLSGGERQRISIARALLRDASVLILDEPTSAVDACTEASLLEALERLMKGRTTFIIAHRLSTVRKVDRIVVLDHGRIAESGAPGDLLSRRGLYRHLHELQYGSPTAAEAMA